MDRSTSVSNMYVLYAFTISTSKHCHMSLNRRQFHNVRISVPEDQPGAQESGPNHEVCISCGFCRKPSLKPEGLSTFPVTHERSYNSHWYSCFYYFPYRLHWVFIYLGTVFVCNYNVNFLSDSGLFLQRHIHAVDVSWIW